jgi:hypothetical protein
MKARNSLLCLAVMVYICSHVPTSAQTKAPKELMGVNLNKCWSAAECHHQLEIGGWLILPEADDLLDKLTYFTPNPDYAPVHGFGMVMTYTVTVRDLGFPNGASLNAIYQRAQELGLKICSRSSATSAMGPDLCLEYSGIYSIGLNKSKEMEDPMLFIGMEPITGSDGKPRIFVLVSSRYHPEIFSGHGISGIRGALLTHDVSDVMNDGDAYVLDGMTTFVFWKS